MVRTSETRWVTGTDGARQFSRQAGRQQEAGQQAAGGAIMPEIITNHHCFRLGRDEKKVALHNGEMIVRSVSHATLSAR